VFTQVVEFVRELGFAKLGVVAIDSTRVKGNNAKSRVDTATRLRKERAKIRGRIREWQKQCEGDEKGVASELEVAQLERLLERLEAIPGRLEKLKKSGVERLPRSDGEARVLRKYGQSVVGYTADLAVTEDQFIVAQRVTQAATDNDSLVPMVDAVKEQCGEKPKVVVADSGLYSSDNAAAMETAGIDAYIPDSNLAAVLNKGGRIKGQARKPEMKRRRAKLRTAAGRALYDQRKGMVEGVLGVLKTERNLNRFRLRGLAKVGIEWALVAIGHNLTRLRAEQDLNSPLWKRRRCRERAQKARQGRSAESTRQ
jgi:IS5 family transposase